MIIYIHSHEGFLSHDNKMASCMLNNNFDLPHKFVIIHYVNNILILIIYSLFKMIQCLFNIANNHFSSSVPYFYYY